MTAASAPLGLEDTGTSLETTLTMDGRQIIAARTPKGFGSYLLELEMASEGGAGDTAFGWVSGRTHLTTHASPGATLTTPLLDAFGNPLSGAGVTWEQGVDCGMGELCESGVTATARTWQDGTAALAVTPDIGDDPLWRPSAQLTTAVATKAAPRPDVATRLAAARAVEPMLGRVQTSGDAVGRADLPSPEQAQQVAERYRRQAAPVTGSALGLKDGPLCARHSLTCPTEADPVFRAVQIAVGENEQIVGVTLEVLELGAPVTELDGYTVLSDVPLHLDAVLTIRDTVTQAERTEDLTEPVSVSVSSGSGAAVDTGSATCERVDVTPGAFTYKVGRHSSMQYAYTEADGSSCCWRPTEVLAASVVVEAEVDDGAGGTFRTVTEAATVVESTPRPADPCEIRTLVSDTVELANYTNYPAFDVGAVYLADQCGNIVHGVGLNDSPDHDQPGDELRITSPVATPAPGAIWATASNVRAWAFDLRLQGYDAANPIPDGAYPITLEVASSSPECSSGGVITGSVTVDLAGSRPEVVLWWDADGVRGTDPEGTVVSPGGAVRDTTGEVAVWRVPASDDGVLDQFFEGGYTDVPVKAYVVSTAVPFDEDGQLETTYFEPVEGVELCTGIVEKQADATGTITYDAPVRTTCDTLWETVTDEVYASSDPVLTGHAPDSWVPMGLGVGITRAPEQPGDYRLVIEPTDMVFRRGEAWRVDSGLVPDKMKGFVVGGGVFLDEEFQPILNGIALLNELSVYVRVEAPSTDDSLPAMIVTTNGEESEDQYPLDLSRLGSPIDNHGIFFGRIHLNECQGRHFCIFC